MNVKDIDLGWEKIIKNMKTLDKKVLKVGIQEGDMSADGKNTMAYIGSIHEYGAEHIPQRSFIRSTLDDNSSQIANLSGQLGAKIIEGKQTPEQALNLIGLKIAGMIQEKITDGNFTPLSPATVRAKGDNKPLIDTGRMRASIKHKLE
ncbi:hypothetical protein [Megamonas sp.]|uniref:hypothetical protein n=1 Tax=Megamonas sp. TaxID=2049033 RepID=UPI00257BCC47|nr:hypothetical protein [Megamonas sp.]MBS5780231.1 hypothetical protein [Megamonas sp.]